MKIDKKIFVGMALLFGLVMAGCLTPPNFTQVETETSKAIYEAASELVLSQSGGIRAGVLISGLAGKFPGLKKSAFLGIQVGLITVTYQDTDYSIKCIMDEGGTVGGTKGAASAVNENTIVTSINSVYTLVIAESDKDEQ